jgi:branched-chain amino acid transport system substrate-binding protein
MIRRSVRSTVALFVMLWFGGASAPAQTEPPFEIPVILSLTGPLAFVGNSELEAIKALEPVVNASGGIHGRPVHFTTSDDQSQPAVAVQLASAVIAKHVPVLLGPTLGASCLAIAPLIKPTAGPIDYCLAPTIHPPAGSYQFSGGASSRDYATETLVFAKAKGWKRIASLATTDAGSQDIETQFAQLLAEPRFAGMSIVAREHYNASDISVSSQLARIKAENPQMLLALPVGTATGTLLRGLSDTGMTDLPVMTNNGNLLRAQLAQYAPIMPKQIYFSAPRFYSYDVSRPGPVRDAQTAFYRAMKAAGVPEPDTGNNFGWDPGMLVITALRKLPPGADAEQVHNYLESLSGYAGINGLYDFRDGSQRGQTVSNTVIVQWDAAKKRVVTVSEYGGKPLAR